MSTVNEWGQVKRQFSLTYRVVAGNLYKWNLTHTELFRHRIYYYIPATKDHKADFVHPTSPQSFWFVFKPSCAHFSWQLCLESSLLPRPNRSCHITWLTLVTFLQHQLEKSTSNTAHGHSPWPQIICVCIGKWAMWPRKIQITVHVGVAQWSPVYCLWWMKISPSVWWCSMWSSPPLCAASCPSTLPSQPSYGGSREIPSLRETDRWERVSSQSLWLEFILACETEE